MYTGYETPSLDALVAEQATVQAEKFQGRLLGEYNQYFFPGQMWREPRGSAVTDFVRPLTGDGEATLEAILQGLSKAKPAQLVSWVDMGGGRALPMRQLATISDTSPELEMTNVDLFNFGLDGLTPEELDYLENLAPGMTAPQAEPALMKDNVETVKLSNPADIITSVEAIQYLNDPLAALSNWYNQLADNGIMIVAVEHDWASWIRYQGEPGNSEQDETPTKHFLEELAKNDINFAVTDESDWENGQRPELDPNHFRIMAIQKKPGTLLKMTRSITAVSVNPQKFKAVYYEASDSSSSLVEVTTAPSKVLGSLLLGLTD